MKKIFTFFGILFICLMTTSLYAETDTLSCSFFMYSKATAGCDVYMVYTGNAPTSATFTWYFDGGIVVSGSGPGPYYIQWDTVGYKTVTLQPLLPGPELQQLQEHQYCCCSHGL